jgi:hypothetical protein
MGATAAQVASDMEAVLSCVTFSITWNQRVDGTKAVKIVSRTSLGGLFAGTPVAGSLDHSTETSTLWISQATFLPIETQSSTGTGQPPSTTQFTWLPATKANLALLLVTIPPGFTAASDTAPPSAAVPSKSMLQRPRKYGKPAKCTSVANGICVVNGDGPGHGVPASSRQLTPTPAASRG